jgi:hypothetical protein
MAHELLTADVQTELARLGSAELVIGVPTAKPNPSLDGVATAVGAGLRAYFAGHSAVVVHVDQAAVDAADVPPTQAFGEVPLVRIRPAHATGGPLVHVRHHEAVATTLAAGQALGARAIILLNPEIASLTGDWLSGLGGPVLADDCGMVVPVYQGGRYEGTLTHALVVPLIRTLFGKRLARPLAEEFGCSGKAAAFLLEQDVWETDLGRNGIEFWIPAAAMAEGLTIGQAALGPRRISLPAQPTPLGEIVGRTAGSLFAIAERYEMLWLEGVGSEAVPFLGLPPEPQPGPAPDPERMREGFQQGVRDLYPVWERILAPETLSDVLALGESATGDFRFPDGLWSRVVYDFLLSYRARVVYRGHVAQSLAPLYLGRVASVIYETRSLPPDAVAKATERLCQAFEEWKPYLVDRWR